MECAKCIALTSTPKYHHNRRGGKSGGNKSNLVCTSCARAKCIDPVLQKELVAQRTGVAVFAEGETSLQKTTRQGSSPECQLISQRVHPFSHLTAIVASRIPDIMRTWGSTDSQNMRDPDVTVFWRYHLCIKI